MGTNVHARRLILVVLAAIASASAAAEAAVPVTSETIKTSTDVYEVNVAYPQTGVASIDAAISGWAKDQVDTFIAIANEPTDLDLLLTLDIRFEVVRNDADMLVVDFEKSAYTGGAHPGFDIVTFDFTLPDGWRVFLPEIFEPAALRLISAFAIADLERQLSGVDPEVIGQGAGPDWGNFGVFHLLPESLVIRFPPYQVASYAAGPQQVEMSLAELSGRMRTNWHTPVPSFACTKAGTPTEKAICSDVALARLDRDLANAYRWSLVFALDGDDNAIRAAQRAWIRARNACAGDIGCLRNAYQERLKALNPG